MVEPIHIAMYADLACPFAYVTAYRLRKLRDEYQGTIVIEHKSLSLEYINKEPTPKAVLELPVLVQEEPDIPYQPWQRPESEWPVTMWPAFEAVKCAERQSLLLADELDWALRVAFFAQSRCICLRHVLFELAQQVGVDMERFADDFDHGVTKYQVLQEAQEGWERLHVEGSPTFVLPSGKQISTVGLPEITLDAEPPTRVLLSSLQPATGHPAWRSSGTCLRRPGSWSSAKKARDLGEAPCGFQLIGADGGSLAWQRGAGVERPVMNA